MNTKAENTVALIDFQILNFSQADKLNILVTKLIFVAVSFIDSKAVIF